MNSLLLKKALPHIIALVVFWIVSITVNKTALEDKILRQSDVQGFTGMAQQSIEFREKHGHFPLWTESMFGGMPGYNIAFEGTSAINIGYLNHLFYVGPKPIYFFFIACVCFYILTQVLGLSLLISLLGSIAYAFATFNSILVSVGHNTELIAIGYLPAVIAGALLILRGKFLAGTALMTVFFGLEVSTQHLQVVYYTGLMIAIIAIVYLICNRKKTNFKNILISYFLIASSLIIGLLTYAYTLLPTKEVAEETMRGGKSQLTPVNLKNQTKGGLNKDYAFSWSYGIQETLTLFVPGMQGGGSSGQMITDNSKLAAKISEMGFPEDYAQAVSNEAFYWGDQPGTAGPVYLGAVICFLFILGMVYVKSWHKWWILSVCTVGIIMAWGRHFPIVNYFLFDNLPLYNKFRAPSMALIIPQLGFALLAVLGLQEFKDSVERKEIDHNKFRRVLYISAGLIVLSIVVFLMSNYKADTDISQLESTIVYQMARGKQPTKEIQQQASQAVVSWLPSLREDRQAIFQSDLLRSILFVVVAAILCWFYFKEKIKPIILLSCLLVLSSFDILTEGNKYLSELSYTEPETIDAAFTMSDADKTIKSDTEKNFRVFDMSAGNPFQDAHASFFHNSIGGYHPAKLALYNDIIEHQLTKGNQRVYNMLNTKYIIRRSQNGREEAILNPGAYGSCWLVSNILFVSNADQEMAALDSINVKDTAIVENSFRDRIPFMPIKDSTAEIHLIENINDKISYKFKSKTNQFGVFSEVYYDKGWNAFIDGKSALYCKVNYILRGMAIPAGEHTIEFRFEPQSYILGNKLSIWASILTYLLLVTAILQLTNILPKIKTGLKDQKK